MHATCYKDGCTWKGPEHRSKYSATQDLLKHLNSVHTHRPSTPAGKTYNFATKEFEDSPSVNYAKHRRGAGPGAD